MFSKFRDEIQKRKKDNKGAAIVLVIVAIAFIGMLVAMILYMAYCNYLMKTSDKIAKDNFYSAEYALDVINAGLQHDISDSMAAAYVKTMQSSSDLSADAMTVTFKSAYVTELKDRILQSGAANKWDLNHLKQMWTNEGVMIASTLGAEGAYLVAEDGNYTFVDASASGYVTLEDLYIVYTDNKGYVSIINTDVRLAIPDIDFAQQAMKMTIENFSLVANDSLVNDIVKPTSAPAGVSTGSKVEITGNVFGGYDGVVLANQQSMEFVKEAMDPATKRYNLIADSINVSNASVASSGLTVDDSFDTYVENINVNSSKINMDGIMYVADDLDISGRASDVTLKGKYRGYGNAGDYADGSSSILINGGDTKLDFSNLDELLLSGHAYVGAKRYDADKDRLAYTAAGITDVDPTTTITAGTDKIGDYDKYEEIMNDVATAYKATADTISQNNADILMGESISVKANQLFYMVPSECIGYIAGTEMQEIAKNPMTYEEYKKLTDTETTEPELDSNGKEIKDAQGNTVMKKKYEPVRLAALWNKLGGTNYTNDYKAVYRRVNGSVLVYLYLDFGGDSVMANAFYKAYYDYDKEGIKEYVKSYIDTMKWNNSMGSNYLTLAGNAFTLSSSNELTFIENNALDSQKYIQMGDSQEEYSATYMALMHSLDPDSSKMTTAQRTSEIFDTLVDSTALSKMKGKEFKDATGSVYATISKVDVVYPSGCLGGDKTKLIVTEGDIYLTRNFEGLAIAGGNIYICSGCNKVSYNPTETLKALRTSNTDVSGKVLYAYDVFGANGASSYMATGGGTSADKILLSDLISYQNWKKE